MSKPVYDVDYFIRKFEALQDSEVGAEAVENHCAAWHCGARQMMQSQETPQVKALAELLKPLYPARQDNVWLSIWVVNDGWHDLARLGDTPRARILAALREIKAKQ